MVPSVSRVDTGTAPHTLSEAVQVCRQQKRSTDALIYASPVDIVAVVVDVSFSRGLGSPVVSIRIDDGSLSPKTKTSVCIQGSHNVNSIREQDISAGDILRFNRISLKAEHIENDGEETIATYQFHHARENPEVGTLWFRLCHVESTSQSHVEEAYSDNIPDDMMTDSACLDRLIAWYRQSDYFAARQMPSLKSLPCVQRSLVEFQSSVGLIGNVVARIVDVQKAAPTIAFGRKRRRVSVSSHCFAMLADGKDTISFIDDANRFHGMLQDALMSRQPLRFTRVLSKRALDMAWMKSGEGNVMVPTQYTTITPFIDKESDTSPTLEASTQSVLLSPPRRTLPSQIDCKRNLQKQVIEASIQDLLLSKDRVSLRKILNSSSLAQSVVSRLLITTSNIGSSYSNAKVVLDASELENFSVLVNGHVLQTLCGGLSPDELDNPTLAAHACRFLKSLIMDNVVFRWTIEPCAEDSCSYQVISVCLDNFLLKTF